MAVPDRRISIPNAMRAGRISSWPTCGVPERCGGAHVAAERAGSSLIPAHFSDTSPVLPPLFASRQSPAASPISRSAPGRPDPPEHRAKQAFGQVALRQQEPVVPWVLHEPSTRLDEALLEAGQRPAVHALRQHEPPPEIPEVVGEHAQLHLCERTGSAPFLLHSLHLPHGTA